MHSMYGPLARAVPSRLNIVHTNLLVLKQEVIAKLGRSANAWGQHSLKAIYPSPKH